MCLIHLEGRRAPGRAARGHARLPAVAGEYIYIYIYIYIFLLVVSLPAVAGEAPGLLQQAGGGGRLRGHAILHYTMPYYTILYYIILCHTVDYYTTS